MLIVEYGNSSSTQGIRSSRFLFELPRLKILPTRRSIAQAAARAIVSGSGRASGACAGRRDIDVGLTSARAAISFQLAFTRAWFGCCDCASDVCFDSIPASGEENVDRCIALACPGDLDEFKSAYSGGLDPDCLSHPGRRFAFFRKFDAADAAGAIADARFVAMAQSENRRHASHFVSAGRSFTHSDFRTIKL